MNIILNRKSWLHQIKYGIFAGITLGFTSIALGQVGGDNEQAVIKSDTTKVEEPAVVEKTALRLSFEAFKINEEVKLMARTRLKVKGKFQNITGVEISFYEGDLETGKLLGKDTSDHNGESTWFLPAAPASDSAMPVSYTAVIQNQPNFEDAEESVSVYPSVMEMNLEEDDSVRMVKIFVGYPDETGQILPITETECQVYVQRLFGLMPVGEPETTDEEGRITMEFPGDIMGDESGNLTIVAKIAEHEMVGNVEYNKTIGWGIPSKRDDFSVKREMWSARANSPIPLIIIVNLALLGIWGIIAYIFYEILQINKLGKNTGSPSTQK